MKHGADVEPQISSILRHFTLSFKLGILMLSGCYRVVRLASESGKSPLHCGFMSFEKTH